MKQFSILEKQMIGKLMLTTEGLKKYSSLIRSILNDDIYKDRLIDKGKIKGLAPLSFEVDRYISILDKVQTNFTLIKYLSNKFNLSTEEDLYKFVYNEKYKLFVEGGEYFKEVIDVLKNTEIIGEQNEIAAMDHLQLFLNNKFPGQNISVKRPKTGSVDDILYGIDTFFFIKDKKYTCQVKPLVEWSKTGEDYFKVVSKGKLKVYKTHYMIFVNTSTNKYILFRNDGVAIDGMVLIFPKRSLVVYN